MIRWSKIDAQSVLFMDISVISKYWNISQATIYICVYICVNLCVCVCVI